MSTPRRRPVARRATQVAIAPARRALLRLRGRGDGPRALATTIPKSGTHLLTRVLDLLPGLVAYDRGILPDRPSGRGTIGAALAELPAGCYVTSHLAHDADLAQRCDTRGIRVVLLIRDPRDVAVSMATWGATAAHVPEHDLYRDLPDDETRLMTAITGQRGPGGRSLLTSRFERFLDWQDAGALVIRFEDLVGPEGGGTRTAQTQAIARLADHLGLPATPQQIEQVASEAYSTRTRTFRRGQIGTWEAAFTPAHRRALVDETGDLLARLGYEADPERWAGAG